MQKVERIAFILLTIGIVAALIVLALMLLPPRMAQARIFDGASLVRLIGGGLQC